MKTKKLIAIFLSILTLLSITGCGNKVFQENVDAAIKVTEEFEYKVSVEELLKEEVIETNVEEKTALYEELLTTLQLKPYGNKVEILSKGQYVMTMGDKTVHVSEVSPYSTENGRTLSFSSYKFQLDSTMSQNFTKIDVEEKGKTEVLWLEHEKKEAEIPSLNNTTQQFVDLLKEIQTNERKDFKYIHTNKQGLDTIEVSDSEGKLTIRLNPATGEVHLLIIDAHVKQTVIFSHADLSEIQRPENTISDPDEIKEIIKKYNIK